MVLERWSGAQGSQPWSPGSSGGSAGGGDGAAVAGVASAPAELPWALASQAAASCLRLSSRSTARWEAHCLLGRLAARDGNGDQVAVEASVFGHRHPPL